MTPDLKKVLIIRFSSFGDINQCLFAAQALRDHYPDIQLHWLTRSDFADYLARFPVLEKVFGFSKGFGLIGLIHLARQLRRENYDLVYDAHNNLRSRIVKWVMGWPLQGGFVTRSKNRWKRLLLFRFRVNRFPKPFVGADSYLTPLKRYLKSEQVSVPKLSDSRTDQALQKPYTAIAPAATWPLKEWPLEKWQAFIKNTPGQIVILGGPDDLWLEEIRKADPSRITNLAGKLTWTESLQKVNAAKRVVGVDTGITHLADLLGIPASFLIGPSAFGYPKRKSSLVFETELWCKPCSKDGRGRCVNLEFKKCLMDIDAERVAAP